MTWFATIGALITLIIKIFDAIQEVNNEIKKQKTEALQSGLRAIVDKDTSRLNDCIVRLEQLRKPN